MSTTALWDSVEKTDPSQTKPITGRSYKGTSPKPYYIVRMATKTFGPCGIGWGYRIVEEKLLQGAMLEPNFYEQVHMARVEVWYKYDGETGHVEHVGQTVFSGLRRDGKAFTDEDAPKKSVTDALIKALSMIGFAGDIFMGRYDDSKYVEELQREYADASAPPAVDAKEAENVLSLLSFALEQAKDITELNDFYTKNADKIRGLPVAQKNKLRDKYMKMKENFQTAGADNG
jgi:hypothetical protein